MNCRHCQAELRQPFLDLGTAPHSNAYLTEAALSRPESWFPLKVMVCTSCWLVQTVDVVGAGELFTEDYAYFSSFSESWLKHAEAYVAAMVERLQLHGGSFVVELAANDGYLLQYVKGRGIPCLGIEPTTSTAEAARTKGIEMLEVFFGADLGASLAGSGKQADLVVANNVLAHVPDINDFLLGVSRLLKPDGIATFEFPHLLNLIEQAQFDTVYHEHYSYLSMTALRPIFSRNGLAPFDLEHLTTHGGSLRVFVQRTDSGRRSGSGSLEACLELEAQAGMASRAYYATLQRRANAIKHALLRFLLDTNAAGQRVVAYGAAAKGNTLLNFAGVRSDLIPYVIDRNPAKQGKFLPGSRIPILSETILAEEKPDFVLILPWNLRDEVRHQLDYIRAWGGRFVTVVPTLLVS